MLVEPECKKDTKREPFELARSIMGNLNRAEQLLDDSYQTLNESTGFLFGSAEGVGPTEDKPTGGWINDMGTMCSTMSMKIQRIYEKFWEVNIQNRFIKEDNIKPDVPQPPDPGSICYSEFLESHLKWQLSCIAELEAMFDKFYDFLYGPQIKAVRNSEKEQDETPKGWLRELSLVARLIENRADTVWEVITNINNFNE